MPELLIIVGIPCTIALMAVLFVLTVSALGEVPSVADARAGTPARAEGHPDSR